MSDYLQKLCLGFAVLLLGTSPLSAQQVLGHKGVREYDPVVNADGDVVYFTRPDYDWNQGTENRADIWIRHRAADGRWQSAINPGSPINTFDDDRVLGVSVDGNRLAVLRSGSVNRIELLGRNGRNWKVLDGWPLPDDVRDVDNLTFNPNSLSLVYARRGIADASAELYLRYAGERKSWSQPRPLDRLNSPADESAPRFAGDGRTLFFRRSGKWYRQDDRGQPALATEISGRYLQVTAVADLVIGTTEEAGRDERIETVPTAAVAALVPASVRYASLGDAPERGERTVEVPLSSGVTLRVAPDPLDRYAIMLRPGEIDFPESAVPDYDAARPVGSLASLPASNRERDRGDYLRETLADREAQLAELDRLRQLGYTRPLSSDLPDWESTPDTLPPVSASDPRSRYARDLSELERMKAKFRRQQEARQRREDRSSGLETAPSVTRDAAATVDSARLRASVQSGLYPPPRPSLTDRQPWEIRLNDDLPWTGSLSADEIAALDAEYARQMEEIEALRTQLREVERMTDKGGAIRSAAPATADPQAFVPNTAYLNTAGFDAIDRIAEAICGADGITEIRVHVGSLTDARGAQKLSEERARTVAERLLALGVAPDRFRTLGFGNNEPERGDALEVIR